MWRTKRKRRKQMDKEWGEKMRAPILAEIQNQIEDIRRFVAGYMGYDEGPRNELMQHIDRSLNKYMPSHMCVSTSDFFGASLRSYNKVPVDKIPEMPDDISPGRLIYEIIDVLGIKKFCWNVAIANKILQFVDSEPIRFDGDVLIVDPAFIAEIDKDQMEHESPDLMAFFSYKEEKEYPDYDPIRRYSAQYDKEFADMLCAAKKNEESGDNRWKESLAEGNLSPYGIQTAHMRDTIAGDWVFGVLDSISEECLGTVCIDAGIVAFMSFDEIRNKYPDVSFEDNPWAATILKDFHGTLRFRFTQEEDEIQDINDPEYWDQFQMSIEGEGTMEGRPVHIVANI